jgi:Zn-dependent metalloprotease
MNRRRLIAAAATATALVAGLAVTNPRADATGGQNARDQIVAAEMTALRDNGTDVGFAGDRQGPQGLGDAYRVAVTDVLSDSDGSTHVRMERSYSGLPVRGGDLVVHRAWNGRWLGASATLRKPLDGVGTKPALSADAAVTDAALGGEKPHGSPRLIVDTLRGPAALVWDVESYGYAADSTPSHRHTFVDARTGKVRDREQLVETVTGTGHGLYSGDVSLQTSLVRRLYALKDTTRGGGSTVDAGIGTDECLPFGLCTQAHTKLFTNTGNDWGDGTIGNRQTVAVDAQYGSDKTWDYYRTVFGRKGVSDDGVGVASRVHYGQHFANAFWSDDCVCMTYGDGDGVKLGPLVTLDVIGHEITHGITGRTAKLTPDGESGGLNEATSDIFGTMIEFYANDPAEPGDYLMGSEAFLDHGRTPEAIRYLDRPSKDHHSPDCWYPQIGSLDVHLSAAIGDHLFYLLSEGSGRKQIGGISYDSPTCDGSHVDGIGRDTVAAIWYRALTHYFTSGTDYHAARAATISAAGDLYGANSAQVAAVAAGWTAVGVSADAAS